MADLAERAQNQTATARRWAKAWKSEAQKYRALFKGTSAYDMRIALNETVRERDEARANARVPGFNTSDNAYRMLSDLEARRYRQLERMSRVARKYRAELSYFRSEAPYVRDQLAAGHALRGLYRRLYAMWCRVARAVTPAGGPDISDEQVVEAVERLTKSQP